MKVNPYCPQCGYNKRVIASHVLSRALSIFDMPRCFKAGEFSAWRKKNQKYLYGCNRCDISFKGTLQEV